MRSDIKMQPRVTLGRTAAKAPGTCGELAQGMIGGEYFLVTCPVDVYSTVSVEVYEGSGAVVGPKDCPKTVRAAELTLDYLGISNRDVRLHVENPLPRGKGMASSTADVAAAIHATADANGMPVTPQETAEIALCIEPSDGLMFPGVVQFDHRNGRVFRMFGAAPAARILILDFGGDVDTLEFNSTNRLVELGELEPELTLALEMIREGVRTGNLGLIGEGATISALANQQILPKPQLAHVLEIAREHEAVGVNVAHSGTVIGMMFPDDSALVDSAMRRVSQELNDLESIIETRMIGGGVISVPVREQEMII